MEKDCPICKGKDVDDLDDLEFAELCSLHFYLLTSEVEGVA